ncbi:TspO and MBR related proteins [Devosia enhydra]|uniref:TspO and MBR related proteins n=1 Tax=Devosia enhydra TaxID=665118 RepID=A0A1K2HVE1_9HYPH|nr:TspO/MBR family protein [Devosia enhydra]SFZ81723.1 TspO and MBR related proteins [Devosia enhydra]
MTQPTSPSASLNNPRSWLVLGFFILLVVGVGGLIGTQSIPGPWYESLTKPPFNPPNWIFGPVWFTLYVLIAIAGWRTFAVVGGDWVKGLWIAQMLLNWAWSPVWFNLQQVWVALAIIIVMLATILLFIADRWNRDRLAAALFVPYAAWVSFATLLNLSIAILN